MAAQVRHQFLDRARMENIVADYAVLEILVDNAVGRRPGPLAVIVPAQLQVVGAARDRPPSGFATRIRCRRPFLVNLSSNSLLDETSVRIPGIAPRLWSGESGPSHQGLERPVDFGPPHIRV